MSRRVIRDPGVRFAIFALLLACLGEALGFPLMKALTLRSTSVAPGVSGWFVSACLLSGRFLLAALVLSLFERKRPSKSEIEQGLWIGGFAGGGHLLQTDGLNWTNASTSAFLTQGYVVVLPFLTMLENRRRPGRRLLWAVGINLVGLAILARFDPRTLTLGRGEAETLVAAVLFAGQIFSISRPGYVGNRTGPVTLVMFLTIGLGVPIAATSGCHSELAGLAAARELWFLLAALTLLSTLMPFVLMNRYQRRVPASEAGVIYGAEPLFAAILALFLPELLAPISGVPYANESLSPRLVLGAALITLGPLLLRARASSAGSLDPGRS